MNLLYESKCLICGIFFLMCIYITAEEQRPCPVGFDLSYDERQNDYVCYKLKALETFKDKYVDCEENLYDLKLHFRLNITRFGTITFWIDYYSLYPNGPYVNFGIPEDENFIMHNISYDIFHNRNKSCLVVTNMGILTAVRCDEMHNRYCFVKSDLENNATNDRKGLQTLIKRPHTICLVTVTSTSNVTWSEAKATCEDKEVVQIHSGWAYSNMTWKEREGEILRYGSIRYVEPEELINQLLHDMEQLLENEMVPILVDDLNSIFDQVNYLLETKLDVAFPGELSHLLQELGPRVDLSTIHDATIVRDNIGLELTMAFERPDLFIWAFTVYRHDRFSTNSFQYVGKLPSILVLGFKNIYYLGVIKNGTVNLEPIVLRDGYSPEVIFRLHGDLAFYFTLPTQDETVSLQLLNTIPEDLIPRNRIIILEIKATAPNTIPAGATIVLQVALDELVFTETYYIGTYTVDQGVTLENPISLSEGYDEHVIFELEEDDSVYFEIIQNGNSITLRTLTPIPNAIIANYNHLIFIINAQRPNVITARAPVVIYLPNEVSQEAILGFEHTSYLGQIIQEFGLVFAPIVLTEGYTSDVIFTLHGDLESYFSLLPQDASVYLQLDMVFPDETILANRIIVLEIQATTASSMPAVATIVLEVKTNNPSHPTRLVFAETYYVGTYTEVDGLIFENHITLSEGYDALVTFDLEGDYAMYFDIVYNGNYITLMMLMSIPAAILANNNQLIIVINARRPNMETARATIVILLPSGSQILSLGFEKTRYFGVIENGTLDLEHVVLTEGYSPEVVFTKYGDMAQFFDLTFHDAAVTLQLLDSIPEELLSTNRIIILEIRATAAESVPAAATIIIEVLNVCLHLTPLVFAQTYYVATYGGTGISFEVLLSEGYNEHVTFKLEGDDSMYFRIRGNEYPVVLLTPEPLPRAVLANNNMLLFTISAHRPNATTARAAVIIHLPNDFSEDAILRFERTNYLGVIENGALYLEQIVLTEGYTPAVGFSPNGDLLRFFGISIVGANVTLHIVRPIPEELSVTHPIIILRIHAFSLNSMPTVVPIILENSLSNSLPSTQLNFAETHYVGAYTTDGGVTLKNPISLSEGYHEDVRFELEEDNSIYFDVVQTGNSVTLRTLTPIPNAVVANNDQLLFTISAQRPNVTTARAAIVINMQNEFSEDKTLGFVKTSYLGEIEDGIVNLEQIVLREGPTPNVSYSIHGDLASFFILIYLSSLDGTVTLALQNAIPEELIPSNRIIILELRATIAGVMPAVATIALEAVLDNLTLNDQLVFAETYYVGTYTADGNVTLENPITLYEGYDDSVTFELEGDKSIYFEIVQNGNSVTLRTPTLIPNAVVTNNNQLLFIINATRCNATTARAAVVINLPDEFGDIILGFEKNSYHGAIVNGIVNLEEIFLTDGTPGIYVYVHGEWENFFSLESSSSTSVSLRLHSAIPEELIPANRIIILEIRAVFAGSIPAVTTIILEVMSGVDDLLLRNKLVFAETYYIGTYTADDGVILGTPIMLSVGYDEHVIFALDGEDSIYFEVVQYDNAVLLKTPMPISNDVVANNNLLLFIINAQRANAITAQATVVIQLPNIYSTPPNFNPTVTDAVVTMPAELFGNFWQYNFLVFWDDTFFHDPRGVYIINSRIISVNLNTFSDLGSTNINIYLRPLVAEDNNMRRACVRWHYIDDGTGYWSEEGCMFIRSNDPELLDTCECNLRFTYYAEALMRMTAEKLLKELLKDIRLLLENETNHISDVVHILDQLNDLFELDEDVVFSDELLNLLQELMQRLIVFPQVTSVTVTNNVALLVANSAALTRGITMARTDDHIFTEHTFGFITGDIDSNMLDANVNDMLLSLATVEISLDMPGISYMVFRDGRVFNDSRGLYTIISRILSINIYIVTTDIENKDHEIKIHFRPLIEESDTSSRLTCIRWFYQDGTGYWTEEGCRLVISDDPGSLHTCQCTWFLTYYAMAMCSEPVTTTETTTTTMTPEDQIQEVLEDLYDLLNQTSPILVDDVSQVFDQVDDLLNIEPGLDFPGQILLLLEELGTRVDLSGFPTSAVVRDNVGLLMADVTEDNPVRGLVVASRDTDEFTLDAFEFLSGELESSLLNANVSEAVVSLPPSVTRYHHRISFVIYRSARAFSYDREMYATNSKVVSISIGNLTHFEHGEVIDIHLRPAIAEPNRDERRMCVYWHFLDDDTGYWSQDGCTLIKSGNAWTLDTCRCDHLTHFAEVLFPRSVFSQLNEDILEILSIIGCLLSIFGLVVIMLTAVFFRSWRRKFRNQIWLQLCIALLLMSVCFLIVLFSKFDEYSIPCILSGIGLHYSVLASFCWMLVVAVKSYKDLVLVFQREVPRKRLIASSFSWGVPALIVIILVSVNTQSYWGHFEDKNPSTNFCYPSGIGLWVAVYVPIAVMLLTNWTIFILIIWKIGFTPRGPHPRKARDSQEALACVRLSFVLVFLFGLPWLFGAFSYNVVAAYFFTCTVTTQGFVLFLLIICKHKQTRDLWLGKLKRTQQKSFTVTSNYS